MTCSPSHHVPAEKALALLQQGQTLRDYYVSGKLELTPGETWPQEVKLENCVIEDLICLSVNFSQAVELRNCRFNNCQFTFSYFLRGLLIDTCYFESYLDFQAGGHNQADALIRITNNQFSAFVNFFDCQYEGGVVITNNEFLSGTNLLGKPHHIPVTFCVAPLLARNTGLLDVNGEDSSPQPNG